MKRTKYTDLRKTVRRKIEDIKNYNETFLLRPQKIEVGQALINELYKVCNEIGLRIYLNKTKIMSNSQVENPETQVNIDGINLETQRQRRTRGTENRQEMVDYNRTRRCAEHGE